MDYDAYVIAEVYDKARALLPATARLWQELIADYIDPGAAPLILDLGCGTGRFSELLARRFGGQVIGIDPSERMLQQARRRPNPGNISYWIASRRGAASMGWTAPISSSCRWSITISAAPAPPRGNATGCCAMAAMFVFATAPVRAIFRIVISSRCSL